MENKKKWPKVDEKFIRELANIHNLISFREKEAIEFDTFVLENKEKINNPIYLNIFASRIQLTKEYFQVHFEVCKLFYDFMEGNPDWMESNFGFSTLIRLGVFQDTFAEYMNQ